VVIALAADAHAIRLSGPRTFVTPTIVHFGAVLALAAYLSVPGQNTLSLCIGFAAEGMGGLIYAGAVAVGLARIAGSYVPGYEDWIWNPEASLYFAAAVSVLLLIIGIHNAWDIAVWSTLRGKRDAPPPN
jgi:hypothetical protein